MRNHRLAAWTFAAAAALCVRPCAAQPAAPAAVGVTVSSATLSNGLRVIVVRDPLAPVVTTVMNYLVGSNEAPAGFPGMAHATEHMMFRGSPGLSAEQLSAVAAALGGDFDADTQEALTQYFFTAPAEDLDAALRIEGIRMRAILATQALWSKERGAIEQEVASDLSNPEYVFYKDLIAAMFKGTPYEHDALGTRPSFDKTAGADLKKFHDEWYAPNNAVLIIAGDVDPARALALVRETFGGVPEKTLPARPAFDFSPVVPSTMTLDTDQPYGLTALTFRFPGSDSPDYAAARVLADALGSERGALYALVPEGEALFASFSYDYFRRSGIGYAVAGFPEGADSRAQLEKLRAVVADAAARGVPADLVEAAKRHEVADAELQKNSVSGLAMEWSQAVAGEGRSSPDVDIDAIRRVTPEDVNRAARLYLDQAHAIAAILTPRPSGKPIAGKGFGGTESLASANAAGVKLPDWAERAAERLNVPKSSLNPTVTVLPNGLKLIVQPESVSRTVSVYGRVDADAKLETAPGQDGVDRALDKLFSYGTSSLDRLSFQKALDDIAANESAGTDFSLQAPADAFERGLNLLAANELDPALPEKDFKIVQRELAASVAGELKSPDHLASRAFRAGLFPPGDPSRRQDTPETVESLTPADVRAYYAKVFRPDMTTLVVIGDVTPERARAAVEAAFGLWTSSGPKPDTVLPRVPDNAPSTTQVPDASRVQDKVSLGQTLALARSDTDYYTLELGGHVLGGGFYASRLYQDLREKTGLVYFVGADFDVGRARGVFRVSYGCDPPNVAKARAVVVRDLTAMRDREVSPRELRQAKVLLLRHIPLSEASVDDVADGWLSRSILGLPLDEPVRAARIYVSLNAADVKAAFAKWLRPADLVEVVQGPTPP